MIKGAPGVESVAKVRVAIDKDTGQRVTIEEAAKNKGVYKEYNCVECGTPVHPRCGEIISHHFAHYPGEIDRDCSVTIIAESKWAEKLFYNNDELATYRWKDPDTANVVNIGHDSTPALRIGVKHDCDLSHITMHNGNNVVLFDGSVFECIHLFEIAQDDQQFPYMVAKCFTGGFEESREGITSIVDHEYGFFEVEYCIIPRYYVLKYIGKELHIPDLDIRVRSSDIEAIKNNYPYIATGELIMEIIQVNRCGYTNCSALVPFLYTVFNDRGLYTNYESFEHCRRHHAYKECICLDIINPDAQLCNSCKHIKCSHGCCLDPATEYSIAKRTDITLKYFELVNPHNRMYEGATCLNHAITNESRKMCTRCEEYPVAVETNLLKLEYRGKVFIRAAGFECLEERCVVCIMTTFPCAAMCGRRTCLKQGFCDECEKDPRCLNCKDRLDSLKILCDNCNLTVKCELCPPENAAKSPICFSFRGILCCWNCFCEKCINPGCSDRLKRYKAICEKCDRCYLCQVCRIDKASPDYGGRLICKECYLKRSPLCNKNRCIRTTLTGIMKGFLTCETHTCCRNLPLSMSKCDKSVCRLCSENYYKHCSVCNYMYRNDQERCPRSSCVCSKCKGPITKRKRTEGFDPESQTNICTACCYQCSMCNEIGVLAIYNEDSYIIACENHQIARNAFSICRFGIYRGMSFLNVIEHDPDYIYDEYREPMSHALRLELDKMRDVALFNNTYNISEFACIGQIASVDNDSEFRHLSYKKKPPNAR